MEQWYSKKMFTIGIAICLAFLFEFSTVQGADVSWSGFISVGGGLTLDDNESFLADPSVGSAMYRDDISFKPDTILGLQVETEFRKRLKATGQLVGKGGDDFNVEFEWAYLAYQATDELTLNAGRKRIPLFLYSEFLDLGYAYHWIRPPYEVYQIPQSSYNGLSCQYANMFGELSTEAQLFFGREEAEDPLLSTVIGETSLIDTKNLVGGNLVLSQNWLDTRFVVVNTIADLYGEVSGLLIEDVDLTYYGISLGLDFENVFLMGESSYIDVEKGFNTMFSWYVTGGLRLGKFTPHITYGNMEEDDDNLPVKVIQNTTTVGIRYDFHPEAAIKLEYAKRNDESEGTVYLGDSDLISFAIDFAF